ncbi:unnamed protein product [Urochloa decumbens]|uniref:Uncharacterized protein n=1 Tax=Urochloa decumbens TaxID=240449 RepID=A0ABC9BJT1_9POAL
MALASRALAAAVHLACVFGAVLCWAAHLAGHILASKETTLPSGDSHAHAGAATVLLLLASTITYFLAVTRVYLELAVAANPDLIAAHRLAAATAKAAAATSLLALSAAAAVYGGIRP